MLTNQQESEMSEYAKTACFEYQAGVSGSAASSAAQPEKKAPPLVQVAGTIAECCDRIQKAESTVLGIQASLFGDVPQAEETDQCNETMPGQVGQLGSTVDILIACISSLEHEIARLSKQLQ